MCSLHLLVHSTVMASGLCLCHTGEKKKKNKPHARTPTEPSFQRRRNNAEARSSLCPNNWSNPTAGHTAAHSCPAAEIPIPEVHTKLQTHRDQILCWLMVDLSQNCWRCSLSIIFVLLQNAFPFFLVWDKKPGPSQSKKVSSSSYFSSIFQYNLIFNVRVYFSFTVQTKRNPLSPFRIISPVFSRQVKVTYILQCYWCYAASMLIFHSLTNASVFCQWITLLYQGITRILWILQGCWKHVGV